MEEEKVLARIGVKVWKVLVSAQNRMMCRTEELYLKAFPTPRGIYVTPCQLLSWQRRQSQLLFWIFVTGTKNDAEGRACIYYYGSKNVSQMRRKKSTGFFKNSFLIFLWLFLNHHHIECNDQAIPKSMLRKQEVIKWSSEEFWLVQKARIFQWQWCSQRYGWWRPFSESRWNDSGTRTSCFLDQSLIAYKESTLLKIYLLFCAGKDISQMRIQKHKQQRVVERCTEKGKKKNGVIDE